MTVAELVLVLMRYDGNLPVIAANWHEEYGDVTEQTIARYDDNIAYPNGVLGIVGSL